MAARGLPAEQKVECISIHSRWFFILTSLELSPADAETGGRCGDSPPLTMASLSKSFTCVEGKRGGSGESPTLRSF